MQPPGKSNCIICFSLLKLRFITELQIILMDWRKQSTSRPYMPSNSILLLRSAVASFQTFEFKVEHFVVLPGRSAERLDGELAAVILVSSAYDLNEFILISPADPSARRLVGTTRIRLLLSSIEMALAASSCELPILVCYGENKLYYGLQLLRDNFVADPSPLGVFVSDSGLKKINYSMSQTSLPCGEIHLARLCRMFLEKVGQCDKALDVSVLQYYRIMKVHFIPQAESYFDTTATFALSPESIFTAVSMHIEVNMVSMSTYLDLNAICEDSELRLLKPSSSQWFADCVIAEAEHCLIDDVASSIDQALNSANRTSCTDCSLQQNLNCQANFQALFQETYELPDVPLTYLSPDLPSAEALDHHLASLVDCRYIGGGALRLVIFLHWLVLRMGSTNSVLALRLAWCNFVNILRLGYGTEPLIALNAGRDYAPSTPLEHALLTLSQHPSTQQTAEEPTVDGFDNFFDALEDKTLEHSAETALEHCPLCQSTLDELNSASLSSIAEWISPYVLAYQLSLLHRFVVPTALISWYSKKLKTLRETVSRLAPEYQSLFKAIKEFHKRTICAIALNTFFNYRGASKTLQPLACELADLVHAWNHYPASNSAAAEHFNVSKSVMLPLSSETQSLLARCLLNAFQSTHMTSGLSIFTSRNKQQQAVAEIIVTGASLEPFPSHRLVTITPTCTLRRPNLELSGVSPQRLFVSLRKLTKWRHENSRNQQEKLNFLQNGETDFSTPHSEHPCDDVYQVFLSGCFGEDCDIR
uniref:Rab3 GTPase-activating protein catalytic subunit n=1 Tax=Mesocestoides corti TaxID=53468 RepID=A0A5K3EVP4_MESCO